VKKIYYFYFKSINYRMVTNRIFFGLLLVVMATTEWISLMEDQKLFQGDMVLDPDEQPNNNNAYASIKGGRWPRANGHVTIPYVMESGLSQNIQAVIPKAIAEYKKYTCIRFKPRTHERAYIKFRPGGGCSSPVGYRAGRVNTITLASGCYPIGTVMHEIGHSIGIYHEQSRPDRDTYVEILFQNVPSSVRNNFNIASNIDSLGTKYDYLSMMHYGRNAFGGGRMTIKTKNSKYQMKIGERRAGFSEIDKKQINLMYCSGTTPPTQQPPTSTRPPFCKEINTSCAGWKRYCKTSSYVRKTCCKTCQNTGTTPPTQRPPPPTPTSTRPPFCKEIHTSCASWKERGYCQTNSYVKKTCCKTCQNTACSDLSTKCDEWAKRTISECTKNPGYMNIYCKKTCNKC